MKKKISITLTILMILLSPLAQALTEVITAIPAYWVERDGSLTLYGTANGPCGSTLFNVSKSLVNYDEIYGASVLAMIKSYPMDLVVEGCSGNTNKVTFVKVCRDATYC